MFQNAFQGLLGMVRITGTITALVVAGTTAALHPMLPGATPLVSDQPETVAARDITVAYSTVHYDLNSSDPRLIDAVRLTVAGQVPSVEVSLDDVHTVWYPCRTLDRGTAWVCDTTLSTPPRVRDSITLAVRPGRDQPAPTRQPAN